MFGQNNLNRPFAAFGQQTQTQPAALFGGASVANTSFGGGTTFGSNPSAFGAQQQRPAFGGGTMFGQTAGGFGAQPAAGGGLFGSTATTTAAGGMFGATSAAPAFGQTTTFGAFGGGATGAAGSLFGGQQQQPQQSNSLFGGTQQQTQAGSNLFGMTSNAAGSLFSSTPAQQPSQGLFGSGSTGLGTAFGATAAAGTTVKFNPPAGSDTVVKNGQTSNVQTRHMCITAMKEYEAKSLEELRMEDYAANRKGPQQQAVGGMFGSQTSQAQTGFGFGQAQKPAAYAAPFGVTTTTSSGGLFGASSTSFANKPLFGAATTTTASAFGAFGSTTATPAFGSAFGAQQPKPLFGAPASSAPSAFGAAQPVASQPTGFGSFGGGGVFGAAAQPQTQPAGGLFAAKPAAFGSFGTSSAAPGFSFGQTSTALPAFGTSQANTSLFGNKPAGFGTQTTSAFGAAAPSFGSGFGTGTNTALGSTFGKPATGFGTSFAPAGGSTLGGFGAAAPTAPANAAVDAQTASQQALQQQLLTLALHAPYGENPLFQNLKPAFKVDDLTKPTNPVAQRAVLAANSPHRVTARPLAKIKPKPARVAGRKKDDLFDGLDEEDVSFGGPQLFVPKHSVKRLIIGRDRDALNDSANTSVGGDVHSPAVLSRAPRPADSSVIRSAHQDMSIAVSPLPPPAKERAGRLDLSAKSTEKGKSPSLGRISPITTSPKNVPDNTIAELNIRHKRFVVPNMSGDQTTLSSQADAFEDDLDGSEHSKSPGARHPAGIVLRRPGYYIIPSLEELADYTEDGECLADNLVVGREGYGNVLFPGITDVTGLNFDEIVFFTRKEINVYPREEMRPPVGQGLNKRAQVTLDCVWPVDKTSRQLIKDENRLAEMNFVGKLERATEKMDAKFLEYRPDTGSWVFEVKHFSKYGLQEEDEDDDGTSAGVLTEAKLKQQQLLLEQQQLQKNAAQQKMLPGQLIAGGDKVAGSQLLGQRKADHFQVVPAAMDQDDTDMTELSRKTFAPFRDDVESVEEGDEDEEMELSHYMEPASHRMASGLGIGARDMQLRKASLFGSDDLPAEGYSASRWMFGTLVTERSERVVQQHGATRHDSAPMFAPSSASLGQHSQHVPPKMPRLESAILPSQSVTGAKFAPVEHPLLRSGMSQLDKAAKPVPPLQHGPVIVPLKESLLAGCQHYVMDSGLFHGRRFRVGWAPGGMLVSLERPVPKAKAVESTGVAPLFSSLQAPSQTISSLSPQLYVKKLSNGSHSTVMDRWLQVELEQSVLTEQDSCPLWAPSKGSAFLHHFVTVASRSSDYADNAFSRQSQLVWSLCNALWGDLDVEDNKSAEGRYVVQQMRRKAVTQWLCNAVRQTVDEEVERFKSQRADPSCAAYSYLTGLQVSKACTWCQDNGDHRLSLLVAQATGSSEQRQLLQRQLEHWSQTRADEFISPPRLKLYTLLSGLSSWSGSCQAVNVCEQLDWKRCFATYFWFHDASNAPVSKAVEEYEEAFEGRGVNGVCAAYPAPPYLEDKTGFVDEGRSGTGPKDACYLLLKLFASPLASLNTLVDPAAFTADPLDHRLSWHVYQVLNALGYGEALSDHKVALLCLHFSAQLERAGLWHWAVFVLLHLKSAQGREKQVKDLLTRCLVLDPDNGEVDKESFVTNVLKVPSAWLHRAKAYRASIERRHQDEADHLLQAGCWAEAHSIITTHLVSGAIVDGDYEQVKCQLSVLAEHSDAVRDWASIGRVYMEYLDILDAVEELRQLHTEDEETSALLATLSSHQQHQLRDALVSIASTLADLPCPTPIDRLCQAEMASQTSKLLQALFTLDGSRSAFEELVPIVTRLPLSQEEAMEQVNRLLTLYSSEVARL